MKATPTPRSPLSSGAISRLAAGMGVAVSLCGLAKAAESADTGAASAIEVMMEAQMEEAGRPLKDLETKYREALEKKRTAAQQAGNLDILVAVANELELLSGDLDAAPAPKLADLAKMRQIYRDQKARILPKVEQAALAVERSYVKDMNQLVIDLTKSGKTDEAVKVKERLAGFVESREAARKTPGNPVAVEPQAPKLPKTAQELTKYLLGTSWSVDDIKPRDGMIFYPNGDFKDKESTCRYTVTGPNSVTINWNANTAVWCEFSEDFTTMSERNGARKTFKLLGRVK